MRLQYTLGKVYITSFIKELCGFIIQIQIFFINDRANRTWVRATQVQVLRRTKRPKRDLFLTMQYGTPIFRHREGRKMTNWKKRKQFVN